MKRKLLMTAASGAALVTTTLGFQAYSDVPKGMPFTSEQTAQAKTAQQDELIGRASRAFNEIARTAMPAVVSVTTIRRAPLPQGGLPGIPDLPGLRGGPGDPKGPGPMLDPRMMGIGSGSIIRKDGLILTNYHVVEEAERITVLFDDKHRYKAHIVGTDPKTDLALIQIDPPKDAPKREDYPTIAFGDSEQIREGDWALAIGSPFGLNRSVSFGIVSAKGRGQMGILDVEDFIQTDAAINPGSSGGPLLNSRGELIGVNTAIFSQSGGNMGIGFAVPAKIAHEISDELIAHGRVSRGWMGLMAQDLDPELARYFALPGANQPGASAKPTPGALVSQVLPSGPAGKASIRSGDVITKFDNHDIEDASILKTLVGKTKAGTSVTAEIIRDGKPQSVKVAIQEQPEPPRDLMKAQQAGRAAQGTQPPAPSLGLAVEDVPKELSQILHLSAREGTLVVGVNPGSPAFDAGMGPGDIILSANRTPIQGAKEFNRISKKLSSEQDVAVLLVQRGPIEKVYVPLKLKDEA